MASENTVSFKVFLINPRVSDKHEVRRFGIDRDAVASFAYLREKLQHVFPTLLNKSFVVSWKDSEGDNIVISSDEELIIGLTEMQSDVQKLYVELTDVENMQDDSRGDRTFADGTRATGEPGVHIGVTCDGCQGDVRGFRYKCLMCADYDLCASCEAKCIHSEHVMVRLPVPLDWHPRFPRHFAHKLSKCMRKEEARKERPCSSSWGERGHHGKGRENFLESLARYLNDLTEGTGTQEESRANYLRTIGHTVAQFLDPLGISVEVRDDDNQENASKSKEKEASPQPGTSASATTPAPAPGPMETENNGDDDVMEITPENTAAATQPQKERQSAEPDGWTVLNNRDIPSTSQGQDSAAAAAVTATTDASTTTASSTTDASVSTSTLTTSATNTSATASAGTAVPNLSFPNLFGAQAGPYFTPRTQTDSSRPMTFGNLYPTVYPGVPTYFTTPPMFQNPYPPPPQAPQQQPAPRQCPNPQHLQQRPYHPDAKIDQAVRQMISMGFTNDGGWLTQLMEIKNGDIVKALDVLQPAKKA